MGRKIGTLLLIAAILTCGIFAQTAVSAAVSENTEAQLELLQGLGLWAGTVSELEKPVTRGEFMEMVTRLYGIPVEETENIYFQDVPKSHAAHAAISAAAVRGLIHGNGQNFEPDREIQTAEALKIMLAAQGYAPYAMEKGGYPGGYLKCAAEIGLTSGLTSAENIITYAQMIYIFSRALDTDVMIPEAIGSQEVSYTYENMLKEYHNICKKKGQITATYESALYGASELPENCVQIDEQEFLAESGMAGDLLGVQVDAYYKDHRDRKGEIIYMRPASKVRITEVSSENIIDFENFTLRYYDKSGKEHRATLPEDAAIIYNGQAVTDPAEFTEKLFCPKNGMVILIDNGQGYRIAKIMEYETFVISGVSANTERFFDKYTGRAVELGTNDKITMTDRGGNLVPLQRLSAYDVASVAVSGGNPRVIRIVISADAVEGKITKVTTCDDGRKEIQISRERFRLTRHFSEYLATKKQVLQVGDTGVFYLDHLGQISAFEPGETTGEKYAYLLKARIETFGSAAVRVLDQNGKIREMDLASKLRIGSETMSAAEGYRLLSGLTGAQRLMKIRQNSDGELKQVTLPVPEGTEGELIQTYDAASGELRYKDVSQCFGGKCNVDENTIIFSVPSLSTESSADDQDYEVKDFKRLVNDTNYTISAFITAKDVLVQDIILSYEDVGTGGTAEINRDARMGIVKEITTVVDENGQQVDNLCMLLWGEEQNYKVEETKLLEGIHSGDGIRVSTNAQGWLRGVEKLFDYESRKVLSGNKANGYDDLNYIFYGKVLRKDGNIIQLEGVNQNGEMERVNVLIRGQLYRIAENRGKLQVENGAAEDVMDAAALGEEASHVLIQSRYSDTKVVAIYE